MLFSLGAGLLEACVLAVLCREDTYGYRLTQQAKAMVDISESTLYPILRRMQKNGWLETYDKSYQGRNRRYYRITPEGLKQYQLYAQEWQEYKEKIDKMLLGGMKDE